MLPDWAVPAAVREEPAPAPKPKPAVGSATGHYPRLVDIPEPPGRAATPEEREALRLELEAALAASRAERATEGETPAAPGS